MATETYTEVHKVATMDEMGAFASTDHYEEPVVEFDPEQFLDDLRLGSEALEAEYDEEMNAGILEAFGDSFKKGVVQLRGSTLGDPLIYRLYPPQPIDTIEIATKAGLFEPNNPSVELVKGWTGLYPEAYEQPDFACDTGLAREFIFFGVNEQGGLRPIEEILAAPGVPSYLREKQDLFLKNGLAVVNATCVDFRTQQTYIFFVAQGPLTREQAAQLTALAGAAPPTEFEYMEMSTMLGTGNFFLTLEIDKKGVITRADFYILFPIELPGGRMPELPERLHTFWDIDTFAEEEMDCLGWSFGKDIEMPCIQAERTYSGNLRNLWRQWGIMSVE